ncbi:hypothetical protein CR956_00830 [Candidatus Saccharibacteria bacterium]|nr:MAG: hypothetical protein CR956_00830 [Candidatus Saccharibacteria bacterium]
MFGLILGILSIFLFVVSPIVFFIAVAQWISTASRKNRNGGLNDYQAGHRDGYRQASQEILQKLEQGEMTSQYVKETMLGIQSQTPEASTEPSQEATENENNSTEQVSDEPIVVSASTNSEPKVEVPVEPLATPEIPQLVAPQTSAEVEARNKKVFLNGLLALGSLLFVAAGIAFIASGLPDIVKLIGIFAVVAFFYFGGILLHLKSDILKPAGVALVGTGLALVPFLGIALSAYTSLEASTVWAMTSVVGLVAFIVASFVLQSQLVAYLSMAFLLSTATSMVSVADGALWMYFVCLILVSLVASSITLLKKDILPKMFVGPIARVGDIVTPLALLSSVLAVTSLEFFHYEIIFGLATLQYVVAYLQSKKPVFEHVARIAFYLTGLIIVADLANSTAYNWHDKLALFGIGVLVLTVLQQVYSIARYNSTKNKWLELAWVITMVVFQFISIWLWKLNSEVLLLDMIAYITILLMSLALMMRFRSNGGVGFLYVAGYAGFVLPMKIMAWLTAEFPDKNLASITILAGVYSLMTTGYLLFWWLRRAKKIDSLKIWSAISFGFSFILAFGFVTAVPLLGWQFGLMMGLVGLIWLASHIYRLPALLAIVPLPLLIALYYLAKLVNIEPASVGVFTFALAPLITFASVGIYYFVNDRTRGHIMVGLSYALTLLLGLYLFAVQGTTYGEIYLQSSVILMAIFAVVIFVIRLLLDKSNSLIKLLQQISYPIFYVMGLLFSFAFVDTIWTISLLVLGVLLAWGSSYLLRQAWLVAIANFMTVATVWVLFDLSTIKYNLVGLTALSVTAVVFYGLYWLFDYLKDAQRSQIMLGSVWVSSLLGFLVWWLMEDTRIFASLLLVFAMVTLFIEGYRRKKWPLQEVSIYGSVFAISLILSQLFESLNSLFHIHLYGSALIGVGLWRLKDGDVRFIIALSMISLFGSSYALGEGGWYALLFLVEHVAVTLIGVLTNRRWATWWGIIASVLGVFYYLRDVPFIAFALLGVVVIGVVIWMLTKNDSNKSKN